MRELINKKIICVISIIVIMICGLWEIIQYNESKIYIINMSDYLDITEDRLEEVVVEDISYKNIGVNNKAYITIEGYLPNSNSDISSLARYIVLESKSSGNYYRIPTKVVVRKDLVKDYGDEGYKYSGFFARVRINDRGISMNDSYNIYIADCLNGEKTKVRLGEEIIF